MVNYACAFSQSKSGKYFEWIIVIEFLLLFHFSESTDLNCKQYNTCTDCIVSSPECTWCEDIVSLDFLLSFLYGQKEDKYKKSMKLNVSIFPENRTFSYKNASLRSRRLEVMGERENGRTRGTQGVSPSRAPVFSCAHYFQAPATQATKMRKKPWKLSTWKMRHSRVYLTFSAS